MRGTTAVNLAYTRHRHGFRKLPELEASWSAERGVHERAGESWCSSWLAAARPDMASPDVAKPSPGRVHRRR
jgi:hypothetical protein